MATRRRSGEGGFYQRADGMFIGTVELGWSPTGKRLRAQVSSRDQATALRRFRALKANPRAGSGQRTVGQWLDEWLEQIAARRVKPTTARVYRLVIDSHLAGLHKYRLDRLEPQHVRRAFEALRASGLSASSRSRAHWVLVSALEAAFREGLVPVNVARAVEPPQRGAPVGDALTAEEAKAVLRLLAEREDTYGSRWAFALLMGARQGECLGLTWDRVDLVEGWVDIGWQLQRVGKDQVLPDGFEFRRLDGGLGLTRPKSRTGQRMLPVPAALLDWLRAHHMRVLPLPDPGSLVWTREDGRPVNAEQDRMAWHALLADAGVRDIPLHSARHTTATLLLELGEDVEVIRTILGHSTVVMTRAYQQIRAPLQRKALDRLGDLLAIAR